MNTIIAIIATYRRPGEVERLLTSLEDSIQPVHAVIVVDNADDIQTRRVVTDCRLETHFLVPGKNLGCGGGLALGEETALKLYGEALTHVWILDDDTVVAPEALGIMLAALDCEEADVAHALVEDEGGRIGWYPGILDRTKLRVLKGAPTPEEFFARCGSNPVPLRWAQGISLLVTRRVLSELGFHRRDYLVRGEDIEFTLRATWRYRGVYVPEARVQHLPPASSSAVSGANEYMKHCAMLQNVAYTAVWLRHGRSLIRNIPSIWGRFFKLWGIRPRVIADAVRVFLQGAALGKPAGAA